jgi:hypothetical protein
MHLNYTVPSNPNPVFVNADESAIDIDVFFDHLGETVRYTCAQVDPGCEHS